MGVRLQQQGPSFGGGGCRLAPSVKGHPGCDSPSLSAQPRRRCLWVYTVAELRDFKQIFSAYSLSGALTS